jgi:hypothetical protein
VTPPTADTLRTLQLKAGKMIAIKLTPGDDEPTSSAVLPAVLGRPEVRSSEFLAYVGLRAGAAVRAIVEAALTGERSARLRRAARRVGPLTPTQWRALWTLIRAISLAHRDNLSQEKAAFSLGPATHTLWSWNSTFAKLSWKDAIGLRAWEAVLEVILRVQGLVLDIPTPKQRLSGQYLAVLGD